MMLGKDKFGRYGGIMGRNKYYIGVLKSQKKIFFLIEIRAVINVLESKELIKQCIPNKVHSFSTLYLS